MNWIEILIIIGLLLWMIFFAFIVIASGLATYRYVKLREIPHISLAGYLIILYVILVPIRAFLPPLQLFMNYEIYGVLTYPSVMKMEESDRSFNGDGAYFKVLDISHNTAIKMVEKYSITTVLPNQKSESERWRKFHWQKYEYSKFKKEIDFGLIWNPKFDGQFLTVPIEDTWIAAEVRYNGEDIGDVYIYILDARNNKLYEINANT